MLEVLVDICVWLDVAKESPQASISSLLGLASFLKVTVKCF